MKTELDLDLVLLDFGSEYERDPRQAVHALQALLLDEDACHARIAFLERLATVETPNRPDLDVQAGTAALHQDHGGGSVINDFSAEIRAILEVGTFRALEQGRLSVDRLDALSRNGEALWQAHQELMGDLELEPVEWDRAPDEEPRFRAEQNRQKAEPGRAGEPTGFTRLAERGDWYGLASRLRPYLPEVLRTVGLDESLRDRLLDFIVEEKAPTMASRKRRFRELMPEWLEEFAGRVGVGSLPQPLKQDNWEAMIDRAVLRLVLEDEPEGEPEWARQFRRTARQSRAASWQDLLRLPVPEAIASMPALPRFRRDLIARIQRERAEALQFFELENVA
jgi:hypothetical protein